MAAWRTLVIDADREAAARHCRFLGKQQGFEVVAATTSATQAIALVMNLQPQLLLLDLDLPDADGLRLLRRLRATGRSLEVIVTTVRGDPELVTAAMHLGVADYVLKPFYPERLRQSLGLLTRRASLMRERQALSQQQIDELRATGPGPGRWLPRDLRPHRLEQIRAALSAAARPLTAEQIAADVGVARTTARRYLEYLVTIDEACVETIITGPGRPYKHYAYRQVPVFGAAAALTRSLA